MSRLADLGVAGVCATAGALTAGWVQGATGSGLVAYLAGLGATVAACVVWAVGYRWRRR